MHPLIDRLKSYTETTLGIRIYRNSLPHGSDAFRDLERRFPADSFRMVFDVGANEGQTIARFRMHFPNAIIHAFEPVSALAEKITRSGPLPASVHLHRLALGDAAGKAMINVRQNQTSSLLSQPLEAHDYQEEIEIKTLDQFAREQAVSRIDLLKIDAEGFDLNVLQGGGKLLAGGLVDFIQVEAGFSSHWRLIPLTTFIAHLQPLGYELFGLYDQVLHWTGEPWLLCANAVFIRSALWTKP